jgi:trehalose 6-phosphate synthase/phosphatase
MCLLACLLLLFHAGFCKQQLWPLFHYVLPMAPSSAGRFNSELWQAYVKANKVIYLTLAGSV